jgi:tripartite-type tricarboxylate transporter receptor subunit TctC
LVIEVPIVIVARNNFPANDLKEFMAYVRANAAKLNMAARRRRLQYLQLRSLAQFTLGREADTGAIHRGRSGRECAAERP